MRSTSTELQKHVTCILLLLCMYNLLVAISLSVLMYIEAIHEIFF